MTYENLMKELHELGYTEIYTEKIADLVIGWIHKDCVFIILGLHNE